MRVHVWIPFTAATLFFIASACVSVWIAPDQRVATIHLGLILFAVAVMALIAWFGRRSLKATLGVSGVVSACFMAFFTFYFILARNWTNGGLNWPVIRHIAAVMDTLGPQMLGASVLSKDLTGEVFTIMLPLGFTGAVWAWRRHYWTLSVGVGCCLLIGLSGLLIAASRGGWIGFALGIVYGVYYYWRVRQDRPRTWLQVTDGIALLLFLFCTGWNWLTLSMPALGSYVDKLIPNASANRIALWQDSLILLQDYAFTGSGLGNTIMIYSSYVFLLHVPYLSHAHNLLIQIAIEQGLPGMFAFVAMLLFAGWGLIQAGREQELEVQVYRAAVLASFVGLLVQGVMEAGLYAHYKGFPLFLPFGYALALSLNAKVSAVGEEEAEANGRGQRIGWALVLLSAVAIVLSCIWPGSQAALLANWGAISQTQAELAVYAWPDWPLQDEVRRGDAADLSTALEFYGRALMADSENVTAHRRLGQIAISRGDYEMAQEHLETAYALAPDQRPTRQMLGEIYALQGESGRAVALWQTVDISQGQLGARRWWYTNREDKERAEHFNEAFALFQADHD